MLWNVPQWPWIQTSYKANPDEGWLSVNHVFKSPWKLPLPYCAIRILITLASATNEHDFLQSEKLKRNKSIQWQIGSQKTLWSIRGRWTSLGYALELSLQRWINVQLWEEEIHSRQKNSIDKITKLSDLKVHNYFRTAEAGSTK